ncbi:MAG: D-tyrosyl-tRNA(Tyr) deacylase [Desulfovibrio sp.]|nr:MAG: D-tyrosyl-tRNA(Tyr) deacylase [Desulfovibrio sp.]
MRLLLQRASQAELRIGESVHARIGPGLVILAGFGAEDTLELPDSKTWQSMIGKALGLRIFPDDQGKMNLGIEEFGGEILLVSQFTLYADCRKGRRPSFTAAAPPDLAEALFHKLVADVAEKSPVPVKSGVFQAEMHVGLVNWGPVTISLDSDMFA